MKFPKNPPKKKSSYILVPKRPTPTIIYIIRNYKKLSIYGKAAEVTAAPCKGNRPSKGGGTQNSQFAIFLTLSPCIYIGKTSKSQKPPFFKSTFNIQASLYPLKN